MNLELLKKLVLLANHNNTEGEANSAARRVCKMIEDGEFKFANDVVPQSPPIGSTYGQKYPSYAQYSDLYDLFRQQYRPTQEQEDFFNYWGKKQSDKREQQTRTCTKCGWKVMTYRFKQDPFICEICSRKGFNERMDV